MGSLLRQAVLGSSRQPLLGAGREAGGGSSAGTARHLRTASPQQQLHAVSGAPDDEQQAQPLHAELYIEESPPGVSLLVPALAKAGGSNYAMQFVVLVRWD